MSPFKHCEVSISCLGWVFCAGDSTHIVSAFLWRLTEGLRETVHYIDLTPRPHRSGLDPILPGLNSAQLPLHSRYAFTAHAVLLYGVLLLLIDVVRAAAVSFALTKVR